MKILKEGSIYIGASAVQKAIPFLLLPFLTRILSNEEYGMVAIFLVAVSIYSLFVGASLNGFVRVIYHKSTAVEFTQYVGNSLFLFIVLSFITYILTWLFESSLSQLFGIESDYLYLALVAAFSRFIFAMRLVIFQTMRQPFSFAKLQLALPAVEALLVVLLVFYLYKGAEGRVLSIAISSFSVGIISTYLMYKAKLFYINFDLNRLKRIAGYALPLLPHSIALTVFFTVDKLILSSNMGLSIVGELSVAVSLAIPVWMLVESINMAFTPWSFEKIKKNELSVLVGASYVLLIGLFFVIALYSTFLLYMFDIIVGDAFKNTLYPALILLYVGWFKLAYYLFAKVTVYLEDVNYLPVISIVSGVVYLGLIYANIHSITLINVSIYMNIMYAIMSVGMFILSQRKLSLPWSDFASVHKVLKILIANIKERKWKMD